jgi:uncharacterized protein
VDPASDQEPRATELPLGSAPAPDAPVAAQPIHFCHQCGAGWEPAWDQCPHCALRSNRTATIQEAEGQFRQDRRRVYHAMWLYFAMLGTSLVFMIYILVRQEEQVSVTEEVVAGSVDATLALIWCGIFGQEILALLKRLPSLGVLALSAALAVGTYLTAHTALALLTNMFGLEQLDYLPGFFDAGYGWLAPILVVCVQPAVFEELAFRGVILSSLEPVLGSKEALLVSALMFAILHLSVPSIPHLFVLGLVLAWLKQKTGSLYAGMVTHFTHNLLCLIVEQNRWLVPW